MRNRENNMSRQSNREKAVFCIYQGLLVHRDTEELIEDNLTEEERTEDPYILRVIRQANDGKERYIAMLDPLLDDWSFHRLGYVEQAILLCGCAESEIGEVAMPVIIDECVRIAKLYGDDSYRLINGVMDRI